MLFYPEHALLQVILKYVKFGEVLLKDFWFRSYDRVYKVVTKLTIKELITVFFIWVI